MSPGLFGFLGLRAVPGVESWDGTTFRRILDLRHGLATVALTPNETVIEAELVVAHLDDVAHACCYAAGCSISMPIRYVSTMTSASTTCSHRLIAAAPGRRSPGHVNGNELAVRAGVRAADLGGRSAYLGESLGLKYGQSLAQPSGHTHARVSSGPYAFAAMDPDDLAMPHARRRALIGCAQRSPITPSSSRPGTPAADLQASLVALPGIGPWTAQYVTMRALGDPDVFMPADLGVKHALMKLGLDGSPKAAAATAERWRPWRSYALHHLWASL